MENYLLFIAGFIFLIFMGWGLYYLLSPKKITIYWDNKKKRSRYSINKENKKHGVEKFYFRDGKLNKIRTWEKGILQGTETIYYESKKVYIEKNFLNGFLHGEYIVYDTNGELLKKIIYEKGEVVSSEDFNKPVRHSDLVFSVEKLTEGFTSTFKELEREYAIIKREEDTKDKDKEDWGILKRVTGYRGYQDRKSAKRITEICDKFYDEAVLVTENIRKLIHKKISIFGNKRLISLQNTTGKFLKLLKDMNQNNNIKEYSISKGIGFSMESIEKMEKIDMEVSKALASTALTGAVGAAAAMGTPALVTSAVSAFATASTGTAISSLSGAAATNATLAWLGGGSLAAGGGGIAAGAATLAAIKIAATGGVALIVAGLLASTHYSKRLTKVKKRQKAIEEDINKRKQLWVLLEGINRRADELSVLTAQLEGRIKVQLNYLTPLSVDFDTNDVYYSEVFQKNGVLISSMNELTETPLLDTKGDVSLESAKIVEKTKNILNTNL